MRETNPVYFDQHGSGDNAYMELKSEYMKPPLPGMPPRYFRVGHHLGRIVINQSPEPHNPTLTTEMVAEMAAIIAEWKRVDEAKVLHCLFYRGGKSSRIRHIKG